MRNLGTYANTYTQDSFEKVMVQYRRKKVLDSLFKDSVSEKNVLEIGCGEEPLFKYTGNYGKMIIVEPALSFYENAVFELASMKKTHPEKEVEIVFGSLEAKKDYLSKQEYDLIIASGLLHEIENPDYLIEVIKNLASPTTLIHINVPNALSFHLLLAHESGMFPELGVLTPRARELQQHTTYTRESLRAILLKHEFIIIEEGSYFIKPFSHAQMADSLNKDIIDENVFDGLYNMSKYIPEYGAEIYVNAKVKK